MSTENNDNPTTIPESGTVSLETNAVTLESQKHPSVDTNEKPVIPPVRKPDSGVTFSRPVEVETEEKLKNIRETNSQYLYGPSGYSETVVANTINELTEKKKTITENERELLSALYYGESLRQSDKMNDPALHDEDRDFRQGVEHNQSVIGTRAPKLNDDQQSLKGLSAVHAINSALGLGGAVFQPLWGAGFQISFKAPLLKARHEFDFVSAIHKERYGWLTAGFSYSASEMVSMGDAIRFAMDHMYDCTFHSKETTDILKAIPLTDAATLLTGFATTIFPDGYPLMRGCPHCKQVYKSNVSISRMMLADNNKLNQEQREIIQLTPGSRKRLTPELTARYNELHKWNALDVNRYEIGDFGITLYFKVPSIFEALENSETWINEIRDTLVSSMGAEVTDNQRDMFMRQRAANTILRQYSHWVSKIVVKGNTIDNPDDINNSLISILENTAVRDQFVTNIRKFIRYTTIGVVALPPHQCPSCKEIIMDNEEVAQMPETVAIDPLDHFFKLVTLSVQVTLPE